MRNSRENVHGSLRATNYEWMWPSLFVEKPFADSSKTTKLEKVSPSKVSRYTVDPSLFKCALSIVSMRTSSPIHITTLMTISASEVVGITVRLGIGPVVIPYNVGKHE